MSTEPRSRRIGTGEPDDAASWHTGRLYDHFYRPSDVPTEERQGTTTWAEASDSPEAMRASREVPEPDSLGG